MMPCESVSATTFVHAILTRSVPRTLINAHSARHNTLCDLCSDAYHSILIKHLHQIAVFDLPLFSVMAADPCNVRLQALQPGISIAG